MIYAKSVNKVLNLMSVSTSIKASARLTRAVAFSDGEH